jgi:hypothetical protein
VPTIPVPSARKEALFAKIQEGARKDVERCFGVLHKRFGILRQPCRLWGLEAMNEVATACMIIHNMIICDAGRSRYDVLNQPTTQALDVNSVGPMQCELNGRDPLSGSKYELAQSTRLKGALVRNVWSVHGDTELDEQ